MSMIAQLAVAAAVYAIDRPYSYRVPEDISVVGYDNFVFMPVCDVAITTYGVDMPEMAKAAAERIIARVKGLDKGPGRLSIISGNLIDKESVRALI